MHRERMPLRREQASSDQFDDLRPQWPGVFEKTSWAFVKRNHWRVKHLLGDEEDAVQHCALVFTRCCNRYASTVNSPAAFMALYKVALVNEFNSLATKDGQMRETSAVFHMSDEETKPTWEGAAYNAGPLLADLSLRSSEFGEVLNVLLNAPAEFLALIADGPARTLTNRVLSLCGIKRKSPLAREIEEFLQN